MNTKKITLESHYNREVINIVVSEETAKLIVDFGANVDTLVAEDYKRMQNDEDTVHFTPSQVRKIIKSLGGVDYIDCVHYTGNKCFGIYFQNDEDIEYAGRDFATLAEAKEWIERMEVYFPEQYRGGTVSVYDNHQYDNIYEKKIS